VSSTHESAPDEGLLAQATDFAKQARRLGYTVQEAVHLVERAWSG
jgi:hypothetical protein